MYLSLRSLVLKIIEAFSNAAPMGAESTGEAQPSVVIGGIHSRAWGIADCALVGDGGMAPTFTQQVFTVAQDAGLENCWYPNQIAF
jgi:hypothetical protein